MIQALRTLGLSIATGDWEIDRVAISVFIGFARHGIPFPRRLQQSSPQKIGVGLSQA
jgi:hypothetical protein